MISHISPGLAATLMLLTASGYAFATIGMKIASTGFTPVATAAITIGLAGAVLAEILLLRHADLAYIYLGVIVAESLLVLGYAAYVGGALNPGQMAGAAFVLVGFALVTLAA